jgi:hypothetical protein
MDKFALENKVKDLEVKLKDQTKKITDLTEAANSSKQVHNNFSQPNRKRKQFRTKTFSILIAFGQMKNGLHVLQL